MAHAVESVDDRRMRDLQLFGGKIFHIQGIICFRLAGCESLPAELSDSEHPRGEATARAALTSRNYSATLKRIVTKLNLPIETSRGTRR